MTDLPRQFEEILRPYCRFMAPGTPLDPDAPWSALGVDSVARLTILLDLEDRLGVAVPGMIESGDELHTPAEMWRAVEGLLGRAGGTRG